MDFFGITCNLFFALVFIVIAHKKMFRNTELKFLVAFIVATYIVMLIPSIGFLLSIILLTTLLVMKADASDPEAISYAVLSITLAMVLGDFSAYIIEFGELPPSPKEHFDNMYSGN